MKQSVVRWAEAVRAEIMLVTTDFERKYGYPCGRNSVELQGDATKVADLASIDGLPRSVVEFYSVVAEVSVPDIGNGYFLHSVQHIVDNDVADIRRLSGQTSDDVLAFGSDGGGGRFAVSLSRGLVYHLRSGQLTDGVFTCSDGLCREVAPDFNAFLEDFLTAVKQFRRTGTTSLLR